MALSRVEYSGPRSTHCINIRMQIPEILENTHLWFVVGLGKNPDRAAFGVARFLQDHGKLMVPIYPRAEIVLGVQAFAAIADATQVWGPPTSSTCL